MKINLKNRFVYTDKDEPIKQLNCKYSITKEDLKDEEDKDVIGNCSFCNKGVYKTEHLTDEELQDLVKKNPNICIYIKPTQSNLSRIEAGELLFFKDLHGSVSIECLDCRFETESIVICLRGEVNTPCQCQECGEIYKSLDLKTCSHTYLSSIKPIFCKQCKSRNVRIGKLILG